MSKTIYLNTSEKAQIIVKSTIDFSFNIVRYFINV